MFWEFAGVLGAPNGGLSGLATRGKDATVTVRNAGDRLHSEKSGYCPNILASVLTSEVGLDEGTAQTTIPAVRS